MSARICYTRRILIYSRKDCSVIISGFMVGNGSVNLVAAEVRVAGQEVKLTLGLTDLCEETKRLVEKTVQSFRRPRYVKLRDSNTLVVIGDLAGYSGSLSLEVHAKDFATKLMGAIEAAITRRLATQERRTVDPVAAHKQRHNHRRPEEYVNNGAHQNRS